MKLIKFEIGRIFSRRFLIVVLIALLFLDAFNILYKYDKTWGVNADYHNSKYEFTKRLEGKITTEKVKWLKEHNELAQKAYDGKKVDKSVFITGIAAADMNISQEFIDEIKRLYTYNDDITQMKQLNSERREFFLSHSNSFLLRCCDKVEKIYLSRSISDFYDYYSIEQYLGYNSSMFFVMILLLLAFSPCFASERESGMYYCFMASEGGRKKTALAKLTAMSVFTFLTLLVFTVFDYAVFCYCLHLKGFSAPLYALTGFKFTPLTCSIATYVVLVFFVRLLGFLIIGSMVLLISSLSKNSYSVFLLSLAAVFSAMLCEVYSSGILEMINIINPIKLLICSKMFSSFDVIDLFSFPLIRYEITCGACLAFLGVLWAVILSLNDPNTRRSKS